MQIKRIGFCAIVLAAIGHVPMAQAVNYNVVVGNGAGELYLVQSAAPVNGGTSATGLGDIVELGYGVGTLGNEVVVLASDTSVSYRSADLTTQNNSFNSGDADRIAHAGAVLADGQFVMVGEDPTQTGVGYIHRLNAADASHSGFTNTFGEGNALTGVTAHPSGGMTVLRPGNGGIVKVTTALGFGGGFIGSQTAVTEAAAVDDDTFVSVRNDGIIELFDYDADWGSEAIIFGTGANTAVDVLANGNFVAGNSAGEVRILTQSGTDLVLVGALGTGFGDITDILALPDQTFVVGNSAGDLFVVDGTDATNTLGSASAFGAISALTTTGVVPEPASLALMGLGGLLMLSRRRAV